MSDALEYGMYREELPPQCRLWGAFLGGRRAFTVARDNPDTWHPVLDLTLREFVLIAFYFRRLRPAHLRQSLMFASESQRFCAWPTHLLGKASGELVSPKEAAMAGATWHTRLTGERKYDRCRLPMIVGPVELWSALVRPVADFLRKPMRKISAVARSIGEVRLSWAE